MFFINYVLKFKHPSWKDIGYSFHIYIVLGMCPTQKFSDYITCNMYTYVYYCGKWDAPYQATDTHQYQKRCIQRHKVDNGALKLKNTNIRGYKYRVSQPHVFINIPTKPPKLHHHNHWSLQFDSTLNNINRACSLTIQSPKSTLVLSLISLSLSLSLLKAF